MKLNSLQYFEKLIETKNYSEVAKYYGITQPAVSMNIKRLQSEFNDQLFIINKSTSIIKLTQVGKELHKHAKVILYQWEKIEAGIKNRNFQDINLGISPLISDGYFPKLLDKLTNEKINLIENDKNTLLEDLKLGDLDLALVESTTPICEVGITAEVVETDQINIIVSKNNNLANKHFIDFRDLKDIPFITMPNKFLQEHLFKYFEQKYDTYISVISCAGNPKLINQLVQQNIGFSFSLNQWMSKDSKNGLVALKFKNNELPSFVLSIAYAKKHKLNDNERKVVSIIKELSITKNDKTAL